MVMKHNWSFVKSMLLVVVGIRGGDWLEQHLQGAMPLLFEQPRPELAGPAPVKMRAWGETVGGKSGETKGECWRWNQKRKITRFWS